VHVPVASHAVPPMHQKPCPEPTQQRCPDDPQAAQVEPAHTVKGAVQPAPPPQQGSPAPPHAPPLQLPALHMP
jgi:hypothetical protein